MRLISLICATGVAGHGLAQAQERAGARTLDEIVVTARKRDESLQNVPLSVQAFSAEDIERSNIGDLGDLAAFAPGLTLFENVDRGYGQVFIRGMQNTPPVGDTTRELASIFIDGIYYTGGVGGINTDNIERVEVIRGPQSALLGRSTFSGAINFVTRTPAEEFSGKVSATLATDEEYILSGYVEGALMPGILAGRLSGRYRDFGGQYTNSLNGDPLGEQQDQSFTGQLFFTPTDWLSAKLSVTLLSQDDGPAATTLTGKTPVHNFTSPSGRTFVQGKVPLEGPLAQNQFPQDSSNILTFVPGAGFVLFDSLPGADRLGRRRTGMERDYSFVSLDITAELPSGYTLSYLGGLSEEQAERLYDFELSAQDNYFGSRRTDSESMSHELRLASPNESRLRWLAGLYYLTQDLFERDPGGIFGVGVFGPFLQAGQVAVQPGPRVIVDREIRNTAVFGSVAYDLTDQWTLSAEGRYQVDDLEDTVSRATGEKISGDTKSFLPRVIAEYQMSDTVLLYGLVAQGIRPTTINSQFAGRTEQEKAIIRAEFPELDIQILAPKEEIWSYELGAKTTLLDGRMRFNINAYYAQWRDSQDLRSLLADITGDGTPDSTLVTVNGPDIDVYGLETDITMALTDRWTMGLVAAWNETSLTGSSSEATIARFFLQDRPDGQRLSQTPKFSGSLISEYSTALPGTSFDWFARGEALYTGSRYASTLNLAETGDSLRVNLRAGIENQRFSAVLFVQNLFDDDTFESMRLNSDCATTTFCGTSAYEVVLPRKRQVGLTLQARF
jgi:iron complex outermembrane receptor protein